MSTASVGTIPSAAVRGINGDILPPLDEELFDLSCEQFVGLIKHEDLIATQLSGVDSSLEAVLTRVDELCALLDAVQRDSGDTMSVLLPQLAERLPAIEDLFQRIDSSEQVVNNIRDAVVTVDQQLGRAEKEFATHKVKGVFSKLKPEEPRNAVLASVGLFNRTKSFFRKLATPTARPPAYSDELYAGELAAEYSAAQAGGADGSDAPEPSDTVTEQSGSGNVSGGGSGSGSAGSATTSAAGAGAGEGGKKKKKERVPTFTPDIQPAPLSQ